MENDRLAAGGWTHRPAFRSTLLSWFDARARALPWRETEDPYRIWVSEVMLQQTRVDVVIPYYLRWMARFPSLDHLARAPEEEVLGVWAGLGYYSRARNLHRGAQLVRERHGGEVPRDPDHLRALPGVGEYTAGAVASIAFGVPLPAVDGNVRRVMARLTDTVDPGPTELRRWAGDLVDGERPGDFNQALMELGALVCTPRSPRCPTCPVVRFCRAAAAGTQADRPAPRKKTKIRGVEWGVAVLIDLEGDGPRVLVRRRPPEGLLAGMWELPSLEVGVDGRSTPGEAALEAAMVSSPGVGGMPPAMTLPAVRHRFSHLRAVYHPFLWIVGAREMGAAPDGAMHHHLRWIGLGGRAAVPLPAAQRRILQAARTRLDG